MNSFTLDPQLDRESIFIADLSLSQLRIIPDGENPWLLLIPRRVNIKDWCDLLAPDQLMLTQEINQLSLLMKEIFQPDKLNIASLGNVVAQFHVHIIARYTNDRAWPNSIWGTSSQKKFDPQIVERLRGLI